MATEDNLVKTQLRIPADLYEQVQVLADKNFRSANSEILYLLSVALGKIKEPASYEEVRQIVEQALAKAGKG